MKVYSVKIILPTLLVAALAPTLAFGENAPANPLAGWELGAYFDVYNQGSSQAHAGTPVNPRVVKGRLFDKYTGVTAVNMVELSARRKSGKTAFRIDAAFGDMVDALTGAATPANEPTRNIAQATLAYSITPDLTLTVGKFYTPIGFEVTKAKDNLQYSRSYTFNYAIPLWHQGASLAYTVIPSKFSATVYAVNAPAGPLSSANSTPPMWGVALNGTPTDQWTVNYVYMTSSEGATGEGKRDLHDANVTYAYNAQYSAAIDYTMGTQVKPSGGGPDTKWNGLAFYVKAQLASFYTLSPRYELYDDSDSGYSIGGGVKQKLSSLTITNKFDLDTGLEARVEYRSDKSDKDTFFKKADGTNTDSQDSYSVSLLYAF